MVNLIVIPAKEGCQEIGDMAGSASCVPRLREGKLFETAVEPVLGPRGARTRGPPPQDEDFLNAN